MVVDAPATEAFPRWLTLGEATFITGIEEETLQAWVASGKLRCDRSLSRRLGEHYLLVLREDLATSGLLERSGEPELAPTDSPQQEPSPEVVPAFVAAATVPPALPDVIEEQMATALPAHVPAPISVPLSISLPRLTPRIRQVIRSSVAWTLFALLLAASVPAAFRYQAFAVPSRSMSPFLHAGDLMLTHSVPASRLRVGDVIAMRDPASDQVLATRVRVLGRASGALHLETSTDSTRAVQHWTVPLAGKVNIVSYRVSFLGAFASRLPGAADRFLPYVLPAMVLMALALFALISRRRTPEIVPAT
jgi:signal peptidase I